MDKNYSIDGGDLVLRIPIDAIVAEAEDNGELRVLSPAKLALEIGVDLFEREGADEQPYISKVIGEAINRIVEMDHPSLAFEDDYQ